MQWIHVMQRRRQTEWGPKQYYKLDAIYRRLCQHCLLREITLSPHGRIDRDRSFVYIAHSTRPPSRSVCPALILPGSYVCVVQSLGCLRSPRPGVCIQTSATAIENDVYENKCDTICLIYIVKHIQRFINTKSIICEKRRPPFAVCHPKMHLKFVELHLSKIVYLMFCRCCWNRKFVLLLACELCTIGMCFGIVYCCCFWFFEMRIVFLVGRHICTQHRAHLPHWWQWAEVFVCHFGRREIIFLLSHDGCACAWPNRADNHVYKMYVHYIWRVFYSLHTVDIVHGLEQQQLFVIIFCICCHIQRFWLRTHPPGSKWCRIHTTGIWTLINSRDMQFCQHTHTHTHIHMAAIENIVNAMRWMSSTGCVCVLCVSCQKFY